MLFLCVYQMRRWWIISFLIAGSLNQCGQKSFLGLAVVGSSLTHLDLYKAWHIMASPARGKLLRKSTFMAVLWIIWKERNRRCFEGTSSEINNVQEKIKLFGSLWVSILPQFHDSLINNIMFNWKEVARLTTVDWLHGLCGKQEGSRLIGFCGVMLLCLVCLVLLYGFLSCFV